jgi:hypothetical protein
LFGGVIVRDFAFTDDRHHGIYPTIVVQEELSLPIQGADLSLILSKVSLELAQLINSPISLSIIISNFNHESLGELEMDVQVGQELVVIEQETQKEQVKTDQMGCDRWASMDDDMDDQSANLEIKYEPELKDFALTIQGFKNAHFPKDDWILCLKLSAKGHLEGVGNTIRGKAKVELQDIGLVPKQKKIV